MNNQYSIFNIQYSTQKGATLLIAVLMASVMLSVGLGVYQRTYKELYFASFWKQAQIAFAAADSGLECAMYVDLHPPILPALPTCFGTVYSIVITPPGVPGVGGEFEANTSGGCAIVTITKNSSQPFTTIESRGYNDVCGSTNPRRVERGLRIDY
ncbi:MAG: hypothetical protein HY228_00325 [Candidatus Yonathbacteria bacterium]|nr:hypothetical protein [Candidatus Yonathbacteria bacterium]